MHWCDYCKVWMQDNPSSRATHERGEKHQNMVARSEELQLLRPTVIGSYSFLSMGLPCLLSHKLHHGAEEDDWGC